MVLWAVDTLIAAGVLALHSLLHLSCLTAVGAFGHHVLKDREDVDMCALMSVICIS